MSVTFKVKMVAFISVFCGDIEYDPDIYVCCDGNLVMILHSLETTCCGTLKLYNTLTTVCCHGNLLPIVDPLARDCCGDSSLYNAATETCCSNSVVSSGSGNCCNGKPYNPTSEMCCGGEVYESFCNICLDGTVFVPYDDTKHICCNGRQYVMENEFTCCCGDQSFNADLLVCCNDQLVPRLSNDESRCCRKYNVYAFSYCFYLFILNTYLCVCFFFVTIVIL